MKEEGENKRVIVWFSCGASSAVAAQLALEDYPKDEVVVCYCDVMSTEHTDNERFFVDVEEWLGVTIQRIASSKYSSVDEVFEKTRYMSGVAGARCTVEMKKVPRFQFQKADDIHIFGFTSDEIKRIEGMKERNPELLCDWILSRHNMTKAKCLARINLVGIELPMMYRLGFNHNNCIGCVKATSPAYWQRTRKHFPEHFARRAAQCREIGARLLRLNGVRKFIDELPSDYPDQDINEDLFCGPDCGPPAENQVQSDHRTREMMEGTP